MTAVKILWRAPGEITLAEQDALQLFIEEVSEEFIPPLTTRSSTTQASLKNGGIDGESNCYFDEMLRQENLLLIANGQLQGFLSFRTSHRDTRLPQIGTCLYVSTIAILPTARRKGFARLLYQRLFELSETLPPWILLRTWSTNTGHLHLLHSLGFKLLLTVPDDRGSEVDTLYLAAKRR